MSAKGSTAIDLSLGATAATGGAVVGTGFDNRRVARALEVPESPTAQNQQQRNEGESEPAHEWRTAWLC